ncbi:MAG: UDP-N-acetylmuramoyl-L-alanyl-D-glutamate--2,6-diaminopimelate ligase [Treponema sp.]|jgi:UDP-N-acetylmuramoyl-L-alanyl-D-glutamate--2,6-diaminopimelate ligase|nr:UDP-N-acetylmuramoyl-L-alanyl-D-glutamate--2,6-diaminopimelate ligase [Treponema sp.]
MEKKLRDILTDKISKEAGIREAQDFDRDTVIRGIEYDSRNIKPGCLYFALPGLHSDGHDFIDDAIELGASAILHEKDIVRRKEGIAYIAARDSRFAMSPIAASFYGFPSEKLIVTGVTGTEGKSTTVFLIWQLLRFLGNRAGFFSTVQHSLGGEALFNTEHQTTPEATAVQRLLHEMLEGGCRYAVVEASSHGLSPKTNRLGNVGFDAAVMTNVTHEHLEFHGTWEQYRDDKANLFRALDRRESPDENLEPFGVVNGDDTSASYFEAATAQDILRFSAHGLDADLSLHSIESGAGGNWYAVADRKGLEIDIRDRLPGAFNANNVMAALLVVSRLTKKPVAELAPLAAELKPVRGRMSAVNRGQPFEVLIDYAHTPSSFQTIFPPLRDRISKGGGRIISLFGSAGERDTQKRSKQGSVAAEYSDFIVLCDEDPRGEAPMEILEEIAGGITDALRREENLFLIPERPLAIRKAFSLARPGDLVLLLGKGHENSIIYRDHTIPFDEFAETEKALDELMDNRNAGGFPDSL